MEKKDYGKILRQTRKDKGMTLTALAESCNIHWRTIQNFEHGLHTPSINRVEQMFAALNCDLVLQKKPIIQSCKGLEGESE
jgi:ribosome-binding protein aMBF1 (putative translation factor)|tara:strand:- start:3610 stop:3852 length:243 start_codon:yes stop_codon:yes gene_type:complete